MVISADERERLGWSFIKENWYGMRTPSHWPFIQIQNGPNPVREWLNRLDGKVCHVFDIDDHSVMYFEQEKDKILFVLTWGI